MTVAEARELIQFAVMLVLAGAVILIVIGRMGRRPVVPPAVTPLASPVDDQVRDVRHRIANVEQQMPILADHGMRIRTMEREIGEVRGSLNALLEGQSRLGRQLDMLIAHHVEREEKS